MGFLDKVKVAVKSGAEQAATKAQEEYSKMQVRKELSDAYESLGAKVAELADRGEISHGELTPLIEQVRGAKEKLDSAGKEPETAPAAEPEPAADAEPAAEPGPTVEEPPPTT